MADDIKSWSFLKATEATQSTCLNTLIYHHLKTNIIHLVKRGLRGVQVLIEKIKNKN